MRTGEMGYLVAGMDQSECRGPDLVLIQYSTEHESLSDDHFIFTLHTNAISNGVGHVP